MSKKKQDKIRKNKKIKYYHPTKRDIKKYVHVKKENSPDNKKQRKTIGETKNGEYLITYTRHLEKRLQNLETEKQLIDAERLRLEQELYSYRNVVDRLRNRRLNSPPILKIGEFFAAVTAKNREDFAEILEKLMLFVLRIRNLGKQSLQDINSKVSKLLEEIDEIEKKLQKPSKKLLKWYELNRIRTRNPPVRNDRKEKKYNEEYDYIFKIILLGTPRKTAFIYQFLTGVNASDIRMTIGVDFSVKSMEINGKKIKLQIWDFGTENRYEFLLPQYIKATNGAIIMYDDIEVKTLESISEIIEIVKKNVEEIPIILAIPELPSNAKELMNFTEKYTLTEITSEIGLNGEKVFEFLTRKMLAKELLEGLASKGEIRETYKAETPKAPKVKMPEAIKAKLHKAPKARTREVLKAIQKPIANKLKTDKATYKVVIFGDQGVGKKTFLVNSAKKLFKSETKMSVGVEFHLKEQKIAGKKIMLQIWQYGGEERFRFLLPTYVRGANGALFMYDVTNYSSLAHIDDWLLVVRKEIKSEQDTFPIVVVGNKADLLDTREVTGEEGINIAKSREIDGFIECSSKTGENVEEALAALTRLMMARSGLI